MVRRFANASAISVRMLLSHRSGIPNGTRPISTITSRIIPRRSGRSTRSSISRPRSRRCSRPGRATSTANTDYTLLGLIIERVTGHSWRHEVTRRVIGPLGLSGTSLPAPGHRSLPAAHAHAYLEVDGRTVDLTRVDPSVAGAAGGGALVTTVDDVARFLDALLKGQLFRHLTTLRQMLAFAPAPDQGGQVGYGLGIERRLFPGGVEAIGHLGAARDLHRLRRPPPPPRVTIALALNWADDPTPLLIPAIQALAATHR